MTRKKIRVGIAGQGRSGYAIHANWLRQSKGKYKIVAVADGSDERLAVARDEFGCRTYKTYQELIRDGELDLFVNAMPSHLHVKGTLEAFKAGLHVVCDKPIAGKVGEIDRMIAAAKSARRFFLPFQNSRFGQVFTKLQKVIDSGVLGKIMHVRIDWSNFKRRWDWQTLQKYGGGNLNNTGPHPMDQAIVLFGERMPKVFSRLASGPNTAGDADDFAMVTLYGKDAPLIEVVISSYQAYPPEHMYVVSGTCGGLAGGPAGLKWKYFDPAKAPKLKLQKGWAENLDYCSEKLPWVEKTFKPRKTKLGEFHHAVKLFYENIYDVMTGKASPIVTPQQVRRQIFVLQEAHRQNRLPKLKTL